MFGEFYVIEALEHMKYPHPELHKYLMSKSILFHQREDNFSCVSLTAGNLLCFHIGSFGWGGGWGSHFFKKNNFNLGDTRDVSF